MGYLKLISAALMPVLFSAVFYLLEKKTKFASCRTAVRQAVVGIAFGALAALSTEFGIDVGGATVNVRDAAPLAAGLIFGAPAGIVAGALGGVYRFLAAAWGAGTYTRVACSVAAVLSGLFGAACRTFLFDRKKPFCLYGLFIGITTEILHMLLIFLTNMSDPYTAFRFVKACALPMVIANGVSVMLSLLCVALIGKEKLRRPRDKKRIAQTFQVWLLLCVAIAFCATSLFTYDLETRIAYSNAQSLLTLNLNDVRADALEFASEEELALAVKNRHIGKDGCVIVCDERGVIVSDRDGHEGQNLSDAGIILAEGGVAPMERFTADVYGVRSLCMYDFAEGYYLISVLPVSEATFTRDISVYVSVFMEVLIYAALFIHVYFLIKKLVVENIDKINRSLAQITGGNLDVTVDVRANEEFASLSDDINSTVATLKRYIAEAAARIDKELEFARQIQRSALPSVFPPFPQRTEFEVYATMDPAREVGGDFYDFYLPGKDRFAFLVADVSGKGIPAAMFMMTAKTLIKELAESGRSVEEVFTFANRKLCENNEAGMFVTAWMGILDLQSGKLTYVNAGHNPPLLRRKTGTFDYLRTRPNFVLAGMDGVSYRKEELQLSPGDELFLYTDGVTEATNGANELFGETRLRDALNEGRDGSISERCATVKTGLDRFVDAAPQFDDVTMLAVKLREIRTDDSLTVFPEPDSAESVRKFLDCKSLRYGLTKKAANRMQIVADEIFANICQYGNATEANVSVDGDGESLTMSFSDNGVPYDPTAAPIPDVTLSAEEREIGGLGIHLVRNMAEAVAYEFKDGRNVLTVRMKI